VKIVLLSGASSIHTIRWANGLQAAELEVHVVSQHPEVEPFADGVQVHLFPFRGVTGYFTMVPGVKKLLKRIRPDLVNAHYASGYATTARLVGYRPWLLSVWGSDVYDFPYKSPLHKWLVRKNLRAADKVASTSHCMAEQTRLLVEDLGPIAITPFGVDMEAYAGIHPSPVKNDDRAAPLVIGTVKKMAPKYGIDTLIQAFAIARRELQQQAPELAERLMLRLIGDGPQTAELQALAVREGIAEVTTFVGRVPHDQVPSALTELDIYVALSRLDSESFGVAIIEAGAAGRPVVVSDAGGLPEVTRDGETGLVVPREDPQAAAEAMLRLIHDPALRNRMGAAGQRHVAEHYGWPTCIATMQALYRQTIEHHRKD